MKSKIPFYLFLFLLFSFRAETWSQKRYWVFFSDKDSVSFDPGFYYDPSVIEKRERLNIPLILFADLPVREDYLREVALIAGNQGTISRWFNAVSVNADKSSLERIKELPFVTGVREISLVSSAAQKDFNREFSSNIDDLRKSQIGVMEASEFIDAGIDGSGVRIAVFDGGFPGVDTSPVFSHLREKGKIIATWDFVKNKEFVYDFNSHGTSVLTCITGILDGKRFGLATGAEFLLARTEVVREVYAEEENWLAAVEWAARNGADIISSSLGYTHKRYFPRDMDGQTSLVSRAADMAASMGILVINAAGNDGDSKWEVIGAPADAESVLSIGGISPNNGYHINFSSFGPTADSRLKPNLVAFGQVATSNAEKVKKSFGTSFSTPLVAGFAACVMQLHPEWDNMTVFRELERSGHLYPYFDYAHGYGIPQARYFTRPHEVHLPTFEFSSDGLTVFIRDVSEEHSNSEAQEPGENMESEEIPVESDPSQEEEFFHAYPADYDILYYHILNPADNRIRRYALVNMEGSDSYTFSEPLPEPGDRLVVYFRGFTSGFDFPDNN